MNVYDELLGHIIDNGYTATNKKGNTICLTGVTLNMDGTEMAAIINGRKGLPRTKLKRELTLFMMGETRVRKYRDADIHWWDGYNTPDLVNTYPDYFRYLPELLDTVNQGTSSKNHVLHIGNNAPSTQQPCISLIQFQVVNKKLRVSVFQRSCDASIGLPADIYQLSLIVDMIKFPLEHISWHFGNVHIYENNLDETRKYLANEPFKYNLNI